MNFNKFLKISMNFNKFLLVSIFAVTLLAAPSLVNAGTIIRPVLNSGLVGYWNFQEGAGTTAYDKSGNGNHGALTNMDPNTDWSDGQIGGGLDFDGGMIMWILLI